MGRAAGRLPHAHPYRPPWLYEVMGLAAAVVFLLSLLAHELSHAVHGGLAVTGQYRGKVVPFAGGGG